jgi:hypothetical protein
MKDKELLKKIWDYCDEEQKRLVEGEMLDSEYCQGEYIAYRQIQWLINKKCTEII